jgi:hypothetical protein
VIDARPCTLYSPAEKSNTIDTPQNVRARKPTNLENHHGKVSLEMRNARPECDGASRRVFD